MLKQICSLIFLCAFLLASCNQNNLAHSPEKTQINITSANSNEPTIQTSMPPTSTSALTTTKIPTPSYTPTLTPTKIPMPSYTPTLTPTLVPTEVILFQENFEDKQANGFRDFKGSDLGKWEVIQDSDGNYIYQGSGPKNYPQFFSNQIYWTDYALQVRIRLIRGGVFICSRARAGSAFYNVYLGAGNNNISFAKYRATTKYEVYKEIPYTPRANTWYKVRIEHLGNNYRFYLNDKLLEEHADTDQPLVAGGFGFYMGGGDVVQFDDILVWKISPP
jgi:hypothetical protein